MKIERIPKTTLTPEQTHALTELTRAVYPPNPSAKPNPTPIHWAATTWSVLIYDQTDALVSHVGALIRGGTHNGKPVQIGGIGGVKTHPNARHRGYARAGIDHACAEHACVEHAVDFSLLVCREELVEFYKRLGWCHFGGTLLVEQPTGKAEFTFNEVMVLSGTQTAPLDGVIDLCGMPW